MIAQLTFLKDQPGRLIFVIINFLTFY